MQLFFSGRRESAELLSWNVDGLVDVEVYTLTDAVDKTLPSIIWTMYKYSHVSY